MFFWNGSIYDARESETEEIHETATDMEYDSGTYGQSDYTVRDRGDGTSDVYVASDSDKGHSHDHIDNETGDLLDSYHD